MFKNFENNYYKPKLKYSYSKKSSLSDGFLFHFMKTQKNKTQEDITIELSDNNKKINK